MWPYKSHKGKYCYPLPLCKMADSGEFRAPANLQSREETLLDLEKVNGWAPEALWTFWKIKFSALLKFVSWFLGSPDSSFLLHRLTYPCLVMPHKIHFLNISSGFALWIIRCSGLLSGSRRFQTDVSELPTCPIFKSQDVQDGPWSWIDT